VLLWIARILATIIVVFNVLILIPQASDLESASLTPRDALLLAFFPIGMCVGYAVAWLWPLAGGIISLSCIAVFLVLLGEADMVAILSILGIPGILFVIYGILRRRVSAGAAPD
jgi:hypothetical protein